MVGLTAVSYTHLDVYKRQAHKVLNSLRDEGLLELNGKTYMLSLKVYETVKTLSLIHI